MIVADKTIKSPGPLSAYSRLKLPDMMEEIKVKTGTVFLRNSLADVIFTGKDTGVKDSLSQNLIFTVQTSVVVAAPKRGLSILGANRGDNGDWIFATNPHTGITYGVKTPKDKILRSKPGLLLAFDLNDVGSNTQTGWDGKNKFLIMPDYDALGKLIAVFNTPGHCWTLPEGLFGLAVGEKVEYEHAGARCLCVDNSEAGIVDNVLRSEGFNFGRGMHVSYQFTAVYAITVQPLIL